MSIEIILYPKKAKKNDLINHLLNLGYVKCNHLWNWPKGSVHFAWFEEKDYMSIDGVEATVYPNDKEEYPNTKYALHTRTRSCASSFDKAFQNKTINELRSKFGGDFFNDSYGKNRYIQAELDNRMSQSRGIFNTYIYIKENIESLLKSLPEDLFEIKGDDPTGIKEIASRHSPYRILYNSMIPFLVSCIEHFFSKTFQILLKYDSEAQDKLSGKLSKKDKKIDKKIQEGSKSLEQCISEWYSFQNTVSIRKAFNEWFNIDIWELMQKRKKIKDRFIILEKEISKLIGFRHGIVHRYDIDRDLKRKDVEIIAASIIELMKLSIEQIEKKNENQNKIRR